MSATAIKFVPFNGDLIKINGALYQIPAAGIAGVANTGVFVNGVAGQNLAASTLYYVYAFDNSGTVTADFSTTAYTVSSTAGNVGTVIKSGADTRSLIGMVRTNTSGQFVDSAAQRFVRSWFNSPFVSGLNAVPEAITTTSTSFVDVMPSNHCEFIKWADEGATVSFSGSCANSSGGDYTGVSLAFDGTTAEEVFCRATSVNAIR